MGTRHIIKVKKDGKTWISQYGQWDGYPTGQGAHVCEFIRDECYMGYLAGSIDRGDIVPITEEKYGEKMNKLAEFIKDDGVLNAIVTQMFITSTFCRDAGSKCLKVFAKPFEGKKYAMISEPSGWEQYMYTIDFDKESLRIEELRDTDPQNAEYTFAAIRQMSEEDVDKEMERLEKEWKEIHKKEE